MNEPIFDFGFTICEHLTIRESESDGDPLLWGGICLVLLFDFRHFVENLAEFDGLFSNINPVDEVPDEGTKGKQHAKHVPGERAG